MSAAGNEDRQQNTDGCAVMIFAAFIIVLIVKVLGTLISRSAKPGAPPAP